MAQRRVVFFDVGNTLLFPNRGKMLAPIADEPHPTLAQWQALECRTKREFDLKMQSGLVDHSFWRIFHNHLLEQIEDSAGRPNQSRRNQSPRNEAPGNQDPCNRHHNKLVQGLVRNTQNSANWDQILPGTKASLGSIAKRFRLAVISNADGKIKDILARSGIAECFESITDSGIVGYEKPRAEIFEAALKAMNTRAEESVYVGDVYSVDYIGASNVGMQAVLFDVAGAYHDRAEPRVGSLDELESWLGNQ